MYTHAHTHTHTHTHPFFIGDSKILILVRVTNLPVVLKLIWPSYCIFFIILLFICAYNAWVISSPAPTLSTPPPSLPGRTCSVLFSSSVEEKKPAFLLVEIRTAIQRDS
jgi:hypothetical protein